MSCHRLRQAGTTANPSVKHTVLAWKAARASLATVVAELAQALPKITSCKGAASFAKTGKLMIRWHNASLTKMYSSGHAQEATILFQAKTTTRETQLGKDVEKQNGINTASVAALLKERLQWRPAITQHYCCNQYVQLEGVTKNYCCSSWRPRLSTCAQAVMHPSGCFSMAASVREATLQSNPPAEGWEASACASQQSLTQGGIH